MPDSRRGTPMKVAKRPRDLGPLFQRRVMKHRKAAPRSGSMKRPRGPTPGPSERPLRRKHGWLGGQQLMLPLRGACSSHGSPPLKRRAKFVPSLRDVAPPVLVAAFSVIGQCLTLLGEEPFFLALGIPSPAKTAILALRRTPKPGTAMVTGKCSNRKSGVRQRGSLRMLAASFTPALAPGRR